MSSAAVDEAGPRAKPTKEVRDLECGWTLFLLLLFARPDQQFRPSLEKIVSASRDFAKMGEAGSLFEVCSLLWFPLYLFANGEWWLEGTFYFIYGTSPSMWPRDSFHPNPACCQGEMQARGAGSAALSPPSASPTGAHAVGIAAFLRSPPPGLRPRRNHASQSPPSQSEGIFEPCPTFFL